MSPPRYIAMWSGPRNISTAMMRSWGSRADTFVHDEPFYAYYLTQTNHNHPGEEEIIAAHETDVSKIIDQITGEIPQGKTIYYQKHMTHHMLPDVPRNWMQNVTNCFLIREPRLVVLSLSKVLPNPSIEQTGIPQQVELFNQVRAWTRKTPPVIDTRDVLTDPEKLLSLLCDAVGVRFTDAMLNWEPGKRETDGVWAKYWYSKVEQSTRFMPYKDRGEAVPEHLQELVAECNDLYEQMAAHRLV